MRRGRTAATVVGALAALVGLGLSAGGGVLVWAHSTQRDADGFFTAPEERFDSETSVLTSDVDFGISPGEEDGAWWPGDFGTIRVRVRGASGGEVFAGVARRSDVERWLAGVAYEQVTDVAVDPFRVESRVVTGARRAPSPEDRGFWDATAAGAGEQTIVWDVRSGRWSLVVMNRDASPGVVVDVEVAAKTAILLPVGIGLGLFGLLTLVGGTVAMVFALRGEDHQPLADRAVPGDATADAMPRPAAYPLRLRGALDTGELGRWTWLVKWLLAIPHAIVLALLWAAVAVVTVVAGMSILVTGRYPRAIFDFNVGVMRWTWRVAFYAFSALGTDRYPPFTLRPDPAYPADLDVEEPGALSRWQVLVKWWLLAIPHYLVVAVFTGGFPGFWRENGYGAPGLIALLAVIAAVTLAFSGRYPQPLFDLVIGLNRWCYRVLAYALLMTDVYPPFRLDIGGPDPVDVGGDDGSGAAPAAPVEGASRERPGVTSSAGSAGS